MKEENQIPKISLENDMLIKIKSLRMLGYSSIEIQKEVSKNQLYVDMYIKKLRYPSCRVIKQLNKDSEFESYFKSLYENHTYKEISDILQKHPIFKRKKVHSARVSELRNFYQLEYKMNEEVYTSDYDRIRGYIIRGIKSTAKQRGIYFNLTYKDFELPEYCPLLNIKLKYGNEANYNSFDHCSIDRVDNLKGYEKGNIMIISKLANSMKNEASLEQLETFSKNALKLTQHYKDHGALGEITDIFK